MANTEHGQQDLQSSSDLLARVSVFVALFGIGLSTLLATVAVQEQVGSLWFTILLTLSIALVLGGGAGSIYSLVAAGKQSAAGKPPRRAFRGARTYLRTTAIAASVVTSAILAVSLLFIVFRAGTPLTTEFPPPNEFPLLNELPADASHVPVASTTLMTMSPASPVAPGTPVALIATVTPPTAASTVQFKTVPTTSAIR